MRMRSVTHTTRATTIAHAWWRGSTRPGIGNPLLRRQGLDLLKRIRDLGVNAPVLMMSGDRDSRKESDALIQGAFAYLHKPFDLRELDRLVAGAMAPATRG